MPRCWDRSPDAPPQEGGPVPDHPMSLGYLEPSFTDSGLATKRRPPVEAVYAFADPVDVERQRELFKGPGRRTYVDRKTVKFNGLAITVHVLVVRRVP